MRKIRDIIRLRENGLGYRQIGRALRITHPVVSQYARDFTATGLSYSQFCYHFQVWRDGDEVTMHIEHKVGDKLFVDFAGKKLTVSERHGGGPRAGTGAGSPRACACSLVHPTAPGRPQCEVDRDCRGRIPRRRRQSP